MRKVFKVRSGFKIMVVDTFLIISCLTSTSLYAGFFDNIKSAVTTVKNTVVGGAEKAKATATSVAQETKSAVTSVANSAASGAKNIAGAVKEKGEASLQTVKASAITVKDMGGIAKDKVDESLNKVKDLAGNVKDAAASAREQAEESLSKLIEATNIRTFFPLAEHAKTELRWGQGISQDESTALDARNRKAQAVLGSILGNRVDEDDLPTIGIVASGGGFRAMIATLGFMRGLEELGLLGAVQYFSGLSGSAWMINPWIAHGFSLEQFEHYLRERAAVGMTKAVISKSIATMLADIIVQKRIYRQKVTLGDLYGGMLGAMLLKGLPGHGQKVYMSDFAGKVKEGTYPIPISTAILERTSPYEWLEFTPFEIGSSAYNLWVKTKSFGNRFFNGYQTGIGPQQSLGFLMGIFGSAYSVNVAEMIEHAGPMIYDAVVEKFSKIPKGELLAPAILKQIRDILLIKKDLRVSPPEVFNFMSGIATSFNDTSRIRLFDAGIAFNLPFPPLFRRGVELYLVCDASAVSAGEKHPLQGVEQYARRKGFKFPRINYDNIMKRKISLFYDESDPEVPVVIYVPNQVPFGTIKFQYSAGEYDRLLGAMKDNVVSSRETFIKGIKIAIDHMIQLRVRPRLEVIE